MKQKASSYVKEGTPVEVPIDRSASYDDVLKRASETLAVVEDVDYSLMTPSGAIIKKDINWTLGRYLSQIHKSVAKLGLAKVK